MNAYIPPRQIEVAETFARWMKRRTPPSNFAGDEQAEADEMASLVSVLMRYAPFVDAAAWVGRVTAYIEERSKYRVWPSAGELAEAAELANSRRSSEAIPNQRGDRNRLSRDELLLLDNEVLPTARRWLNIPGLASHAKQTLTYWGEAA